MKHLRYGIVLLLILLMVSLFGCQLRTYRYSFDQDIENIQQVEIRRYDYYTESTTQICIMDKEDALALLKDISTLESYRHWGDHTRDYGEIVIYITYENGEAEVVGIWNSARVDIEGEWWIKVNYFDSQEWCTVLLKYVDQSLVPELEKYFEGQGDGFA